MRRVFTKPCPFCGKGSTVKQAGLGQAHGWRVVCTNPGCAAEGPFNLESELMAKLYWNQRVSLDQVAKVDRNDPGSLNKAVMGGLAIWTKNAATNVWERVREARSIEGRIHVRTERPDWMALKEIYVGIAPNEQEQTDAANVDH